MEKVYQNDSKVKTLDPPKPSFFIGGVAKITICPLPPNAPKRSPKRYRKWYPNRCKIKKRRVPKITGPCAWTMRANEQQVRLPGVPGWGTTNPIKPAFFHFFRKWDPSGGPGPLLWDGLYFCAQAWVSVHVVAGPLQPFAFFRLRPPLKCSQKRPWLQTVWEGDRTLGWPVF